MFLKIDPQSSKPIYQQIVDQIRLMIAQGYLLPSDRLPTVRDVAIQMRINRNTVARAYLELEREGVICTRIGQGSFVNYNPPILTAEYMNSVVTKLIDELLAQAHHFRISREQLLALIDERLEKIALIDSESH